MCPQTDGIVKDTFLFVSVRYVNLQERCRGALQRAARNFMPRLHLREERCNAMFSRGLRLLLTHYSVSEMQPVGHNHEIIKTVTSSNV